MTIAGWIDFVGYGAAALVLATFSLRSMTALRAMAIVSNLLFIAYASLADLAPVLVLHALLLPLNLVRLWQLLRLAPTAQGEKCLQRPSVLRKQLSKR
ncbi:MAG: hypothetical protein EOO24_52870 [Comamonadaceae bacterium]|nr:MAG: hypothetical protein EOO24_52870 [Comamonadaceae bacterium]